MVHALGEAHRVLKTDGLLIDLRPAAVHRRAGIEVDGCYRQLGTLREKLDEDRIANRAVAQVIHDGIFQNERRIQFDCRRVLDTLDDLRAWIDEAIAQGEMPPHDWLLRRVQQELAGVSGKKKIVVRGPLVMKVLRKIES